MRRARSTKQIRPPFASRRIKILHSTIFILLLVPRQRHGGLNREEEAEFYLELAKMDRKEAEAIMQITTSWHEKGRAEGLMEGIKEGIKEGRLETARADLKKGLPEDVVAEITGLDREIIRKLKAELNRA